MGVWSKNRLHFGKNSGKVPHNPKMSAQEPLSVAKEVETMLKKGVIQKASLEKGQFLRNLLSQQTFD